jgi:hypothetical protein
LIQRHGCQRSAPLSIIHITPSPRVISFSAAQGNSGLSSSNHAIMLGSEGKKALMYVLFYYGAHLIIVVVTSWKAFVAKGHRLFEGLDDSACACLDKKLLLHYKELIHFRSTILFL